MVHEEKLSAVLSDFARTLATDFPIQGILDHLVECIVEVLPVTSAGVTLISPGVPPHYIAASDDDALRFELLQTETGHGPCVTAYETGEPVAVPDLSSEDRFPRFTSVALSAGLAATFTFPLRHGDGRLGALDLYRDTPGDLEPHDMGVAQTLADVAAAYLLNAQARDEARAASDLFHHNALHDPLTGLPNRLLLQERIEHAGLRASRSHSNAAVLFADLDRFKQVNDTHGHRVGDELLVAIAHRLSGLVRPGDTLARVSGDEFVFLCEDLDSAADAEALARRIDEAFDDPFVLGDLRLSMTASVGMAFAGPGEGITQDLVVKADIAMYQMKNKGGAGHQLLDLREARHSNELNGLEDDLRSAFTGGDLDVVFQPVVRSRDGLLTGVEALLRWTHPARGAVPPRSMVRVAEQSGLINEIGAWVLERSCRERVRWAALHPGLELDLAVNVSGRQLMSRDFRSVVTRALERTGMDPDALVLEVTEDVLIEDSSRSMTVLGDLRRLGIRLALDDFGTGYSSLSYLRRLPVDIVKIDQSFISDIDASPTGGAIVAAVTELAHVLGLTVTAEGVETEAHRDQVSEIGCELAQGYYFSEPESAAEIAARLGVQPPGPVYLPAPRRVLLPEGRSEARPSTV